MFVNKQEVLSEVCDDGVMDVKIVHGRGLQCYCIQDFQWVKQAPKKS